MTTFVSRSSRQAAVSQFWRRQRLENGVVRWSVAALSSDAAAGWMVRLRVAGEGAGLQAAGLAAEAAVAVEGAILSVFDEPPLGGLGAARTGAGLQLAREVRWFGLDAAPVDAGHGIPFFISLSRRRPALPGCSLGCGRREARGRVVLPLRHVSEGGRAATKRGSCPAHGAALVLERECRTAGAFPQGKRG